MEPIRKFHMEVETELPEFQGHENYRKQMALILRSVADRVERGIYQDTIGSGNKTIGFFDLSYEKCEVFKDSDKIFEQSNEIFKQSNELFKEMNKIFDRTGGTFSRMRTVFRRKSS